MKLKKEINTNLFGALAHSEVRIYPLSKVHLFEWSYQVSGLGRLAIRILMQVFVGLGSLGLGVIPAFADSIMKPGSANDSSIAEDQLYRNAQIDAYKAAVEKVTEENKVQFKAAVEKEKAMVRKLPELGVMESKEPFPIPEIKPSDKLPNTPYTIDDVMREQAEQKRKEKVNPALPISRIKDNELSPDGSPRYPASVGPGQAILTPLGDQSEGESPAEVGLDGSNIKKRIQFRKDQQVQASIPRLPKSEGAVEEVKMTRSSGPIQSLPQTDGQTSVVEMGRNSNGAATPPGPNLQENAEGLIYQERGAIEEVVITRSKEPLPSLPQSETGTVTVVDIRKESASGTGKAIPSLPLAADPESQGRVEEVEITRSNSKSVIPSLPGAPEGVTVIDMKNQAAEAYE